MANQEQEILGQLKKLLKPYVKKLHVKSDGERGIYVQTNKTDIKGNREFFAGAEIKKNYVSFYLMPIYCFPELAGDISPELRKRMQGKSCFNFKTPDAALFEELGGHVKSGFEKYKAEGKI